MSECTVQGLPSTGTLSPSGLKVAGKVTEITIDAVSWTALPAVALLGRNAISIQNRSATEIKVNYDPAVVGYIGMVIPTNGERFYDITDTITIYAKANAGTPVLFVEEIS